LDTGFQHFDRGSIVAHIVFQSGQFGARSN
jgi:hypothetical protein